MKRLWFSAVFLLTAVGFCIWEQAAVYPQCSEMIRMIDAAIEERDANEKKDMCAQIEEEWARFDTRAQYICDHSILHSAEISVGTLKDLNNLNEEDTNEALIEAKSEIRQVLDHSAISLSNIL